MSCGFKLLEVSSVYLAGLSLALQLFPDSGGSGSAAVAGRIKGSRGFSFEFKVL